MKLENKKIFKKNNEKEIEDKDEVNLVFVLDKSGSMYSLVDDTIGGFNSLIEEQRKNFPNTFVTLVLFDTAYKVIYERKPITEVEELTTDVYYASGCTALLDAVGKTITTLDRTVKGNVLFAITTDGMENSSKEYKRSDIKNMIKNHDWEFIFLGANIDSFREAESIGIDEIHSANYAPTGMGEKVKWRCVGVASNSISNGHPLLNREWKRKLEE